MMNLFELPQMPLAEEFVEILAQSGNVRVERIVSAGHATDWLTQDETELVILLQGMARLEYEDSPPVDLKAGDYIIINPREKHRVVYTSVKPPCVWLCVFYYS